MLSYSLFKIDREKKIRDKAQKIARNKGVRLKFSRAESYNKIPLLRENSEESLAKDPRFKTILNDMLKYDSKVPGRIVNFKFRPAQEKPNFYIRKYSPEKIRVRENEQLNKSLLHDRDPHHRYGRSLRNS